VVGGVGGEIVRGATMNGIEANGRDERRKETMEGKEELVDEWPAGAMDGLMLGRMNERGVVE